MGNIYMVLRTLKKFRKYTASAQGKVSMLSGHRLCQRAHGKEGTQPGMGRKGNQAPGVLNKGNYPQWYFVAGLTYSIKSRIAQHSVTISIKNVLKTVARGTKVMWYKQRLGRFQKWGVSTPASCVSCCCALYTVHRKKLHRPICSCDRYFISLIS